VEKGPPLCEVGSNSLKAKGIPNFKSARPQEEMRAPSLRAYPCKNKVRFQSLGLPPMRGVLDLFNALLSSAGQFPIGWFFFDQILMFLVVVGSSAIQVFHPSLFRTRWLGPNENGPDFQSSLDSFPCKSLETPGAEKGDYGRAFGGIPSVARREHLQREVETLVLIRADLQKAVDRRRAWSWWPPTRWAKQPRWYWMRPLAYGLMVLAIAARNYAWAPKSR
jgi:hypothetical protein